MNFVKRHGKLTKSLIFYEKYGTKSKYFQKALNFSLFP